MSKEGGVVDKRTIVRVGLHARSHLLASVVRPSPQHQAPPAPQAPPTPTGEQQYQFLKGHNLSVSDGDMSGNGEDDDSDTARRREVGSRAPSFRFDRKLYNGLASSVGVTAYKLERDDSSDGQLTQDSNDASEDHGSSALGPTYQLVSQDDDVGGDEGLQAITLKNIAAGGVPTSGATIVQYTQGPDGQLFIPVHQLNASGLVFPPGLMVSSGGGGPGCSPQMGLDDSCKKRELRLLKNKEAAKECRRKKKEYVKCLENRVAVLENQNKTLIEELKSLKELYCQKEIHS